MSNNILFYTRREELALSLNGRKNNIKKKDFNYFAGRLLINEKALLVIFNNFQRTVPFFNNLISRSFLSETMKEKYLNLIAQRYDILFS